MFKTSNYARLYELRKCVKITAVTDEKQLTATVYIVVNGNPVRRIVNTEEELQSEFDILRSNARDYIWHLRKAYWDKNKLELTKTR